MSPNNNLSCKLCKLFFFNFLFFFFLILSLLCKGVSAPILESRKEQKSWQESRCQVRGPRWLENTEHGGWCFLRHVNLQVPLLSSGPPKRAVHALAVTFIVKDSTSLAVERVVVETCCTGRSVSADTAGGSWGTLACLACASHRAAAVCWTCHRCQHVLGWAGCQRPLSKGRAAVRSCHTRRGFIPCLSRCLRLRAEAVGPGATLQTYLMVGTLIYLLLSFWGKLEALSARSKQWRRRTQRQTLVWHLFLRWWDVLCLGRSCLPQARVPPSCGHPPGAVPGAARTNIWMGARDVSFDP